MLRTITAQVLILLGLWLLWSGIYTPVILLLGLISCCIVATLSARLGVLENDGSGLLFTWRMLGYLPWLLWEIVKSNITVTRQIWNPKPEINPQVVYVKADQRTELGLVLHANSITLTPGTITIDTTRSEIAVHVLTDELAEDLQRGEINRRCNQVEQGV